MPKKLSTEDFITRAKIIHGDYYDYSLVSYEDTQTPITIICPKHGQWDQRPKHHLLGKACRNCTMVKKHGPVHPSRKPEANAKRMATNIEKYGATHPMSNTAVSASAREKRKATFDRLYGGHPMKDKLISTKASNTWKKKNVDDIDQIMKKKAKTYSEKYGYTNPFDDKKIQQSIYELRRERGEWTKEDDLPDFQAFKRKVLSMTEKAWREYHELINPNGHERGQHFHLDHRYSITMGYKDGISEHVLSHPANLTIIPSRENRSKGNKCSITWELLLKNIRNFDRD